MIGRRLLALALGGCCLAASAQAQQPGPATAPQSQPAPAMHWLQRLGLRAAQVQRVVPVIDRVVLVPDAATYLDELRRWSPRGRWPVLIEDDRLAAMFVRRFAPRELIRRDSVAAAQPMSDDPQARRRAIEAIVVGAIGGDPARQSIRQAFDAQRYAPPGAVIASMNDPAWTAALALAAGRLQPLIWIDDDFGPVSGEADDAAARRFASAIEAALDELRWPFRALGDDIDALTICRSVPVAARVNLPDDQRLKTPQHADGPVALTDFLGRNADGSRFALCGWIFGDERRAAYMAMCSLFLPRDNALLLNTYAIDGEWGLYSTAPAADLLQRAGLQVQHHFGERDMSEMGWRRMIASGLAADVIIMNSGGYHDYFNLAGNTTARSGDVPVLHHPVALHLIHSWSLRAPDTRASVGGRWLDHGAYAMVGSCYEPFLVAFVPPQALASRLSIAMPLLPASRRLAEDGLAMPWRVVTIGDPLMLVPPLAGGAAGQLLPQRIAQGADDGTNLMEEVKSLMRAADADGRAEDFVESMRILEMLGRDQIVIQMWRLSQHKGLVSGKAASMALPALFRTRDAEGFLEAWMAGGPRTPQHLDMLWHLMQGRLGGGEGLDQLEVLTQLQHAVRADAPAADVERLAPRLMRAFGRDHVRAFIQREAARATDAEQQRILQELAGRY